MVDAVVGFVLDILKELLVNQAKLLPEAKDQVESLKKHQERLKRILDRSTTNCNNDETLKEHMRHIREACYDIEDVIECFDTQEAKAKSRKVIGRVILAAKLPSVLEDCKQINSDLEHINKREWDAENIINSKWDVSGINGQNDRDADDKISGQKKDSSKRKKKIVGFNDVAETIINYLTEEKEELDVISITGMPGLGKTTLACKIFHDPKIIYEFKKRIWVDISQEFRTRDVFLTILKDCTTIKDEREQTDSDIAQIIQKFLEKEKFLIVLDDVWTAGEWNSLQDAFPKSNYPGKVLITSRNEEVARMANRNRDSHRLRPMTPEEGWKLLQLEVFDKEEDCPNELTTFGKRIVEQCGRLPIAIVGTGADLVKKVSFEDIGVAKDKWEKVSESTYMYSNDGSGNQMENSISLSYNKLSYNSRLCFLYLGMFPEGKEIPVRKLIRMWIAEGFIQQKERMSLEETAEDYLEDLIHQNLVMVEKVSPDGKIKTCRIHNMLREFCRNEARSEREYFFQEMKDQGGALEPALPKMRLRRLCIHSDTMSLPSSIPSGSHIRSLVCFPRKEEPLQRECISFNPKAFKVLRVLEAKSFNFQRSPSELTELVHIRYICISSNFVVLPKAISKLWNLETLIVYTSSHILDIKANIWKMTRLRYVKTDASAMLPKPSKSIEKCEVLQTLGTISHRSCTDDVFKRISTLKKLGIRGKLARIFDAQGLEELVNLEKLKLVNEGPFLSLSEKHKFPPKLRSLTLSKTSLDWHNVSTLGMLGTLEILKLKNNTFTGTSWEVTGRGFQHLEVLHIECTDLVTWKASGDNFPRLRWLKLRECKKLQNIPFDLNTSLLKLELKCVSASVKASAREIETVKKHQQQKEGPKRGGFKLVLDESQA